MIPALGSLSPETRHLNLRWSIADADKVIAMAGRGSSASQIATAMQCRVDEVVAFGVKNGVFIRTVRIAS